MNSSPSNEQRSQQRTVEFVDEVVAATRSQLNLFWYPMVVFGVISLGGAIVAALYGPRALGLYWLVAGPVGSIATTRFYTRREKLAGLGRSARPYFVIVVALAVGLFSFPAFFSGDPGWVIAGWTGLCYLGFAALERSWPTAIAGLSLVLTGSLLLVAVDSEFETAIASAVTGIMLLAAGRWAYNDHVKL